MAQYDAPVALAKRLILKYGEAATISRTVPGTPPDATKPWEPGAPQVSSVGVSAVFLNESLLRRDTMVKEGQSFALVPASDLAVEPDPTTDAVVRADGRRYAIDKVEPLNPAGQPVMYELTIRR